jgi:ATP-dependent Clp protease protease subunit
MNIGNDFKKYTSSMGISESKLFKNIRNMSSFALSELDHLTPIDIYTKLLSDKIIFLNGEIDDYSCEIVKAQLLYLESLDSKCDINLYINSPGGSVYDGLGLLDTMDYVKNDVCTINTGLAASMAAIILCSGAPGKRKALRRSRTMIHQPLSYGGFSQASDMEINTRETLNLKKELNIIISETTNTPYEKVHIDVDRDYWMTAIDAKNYGMIDEILIRK